MNALVFLLKQEAKKEVCSICADLLLYKASVSSFRRRKVTLPAVMGR